MRVVGYKAKRDMDIVLGWWKEKAEGKEIGKEVLMGKGFTVLTNEGLPLAVAFIYYQPYPKRKAHLTVQYPLALDVFEIADPSASPILRGRAIHLLVATREKYAKNCGAMFVASCSDNKEYNKFLKSRGYKHAGYGEKLIKEL